MYGACTVFEYPFYDIVIAIHVCRNIFPGLTGTNKCTAQHMYNTVIYTRLSQLKSEWCIIIEILVFSDSRSVKYIIIVILILRSDRKSSARVVMAVHKRQSFFSQCTPLYASAVSESAINRLSNILQHAVETVFSS